MAKRWGRGILMGALAACGLPTVVAAQQPMMGSDPIPLARSSMGSQGSSFPGMSGGVMPSSYEGAPMSGGMGGGPGMPPSFLPTGQLPGTMMGGGTPAPLGRKEYKGHNWCHFDSDGGHFWFSFGWMALQRGELKNQLLAVRDPVGNDSGIPPTSNLPAILTFQDTPVEMASGYRLAIGFYYEDMLWELSGWAIPRDKTGTKVLVLPGFLSSYFFNIPDGFQGTNGSLWWDADVMTLRQESSFYNIEANTHAIAGGDNWTYDLTFGARYMQVNEKLTYFTSDDAVQIGPVPFTDATMSASAQNNLLGLQIGLGSSYQFGPMFGISWDNRGGVYADYMDVNHTLVRGDGVFAYDQNVQKWNVAASYETGAFFHVDANFVRVKAGYEFKWLFNVATAQNQFDFDLQSVQTKLDTNGNIFYHGPTVMLDIIW